MIEVVRNEWVVNRWFRLFGAHLLVADHRNLRPGAKFYVSIGWGGRCRLGFDLFPWKLWTFR